MNRIDKIKSISERIEQNKDKLDRLTKTYERAYEPKSFRGIPSYEDQGMPHGSKKEYRIEQYYEEKQRLLALIEIDTQILENLKSESYKSKSDTEDLELLNNTSERIKFLRNKGYTQKECAEILGITERAVRYAERRFKNESKMYW